MPAPVLVVYDEKDMRDKALAALRTAGLAVVGFDDPMKALDAIELDSSARVLVTRVHFGAGKLNGLALARMLRSKQPKIQPVFVGTSEHSAPVRGIGPVLPVPLDPDALVDVVEQLLRP